MNTTVATPTKNGTAKDTAHVIEVPNLSERTVTITVRGLSPLICHAWSEKAKKQMRDKQTGKASTGKVAKNPEQDFQDSLYPLPGGGYGFPTIAFKGAFVRAGTYCDMKMTYLRGAFFIDGEMLEIRSTGPEMREDMVRVGMGVADIRYRGQFTEWAVDIPVTFNARAISLEQLVNLARIAGFSVGIGEWRPEKDGQYGRFSVEAVEESH